MQSPWRCAPKPRFSWPPEVLERSTSESSNEGEEAEKKYKDLLESMDPNEFGKYKM
jgi:hypothetical protein